MNRGPRWLAQIFNLMIMQLLPYVGRPRTDSLKEEHTSGPTDGAWSGKGEHSVAALASLLRRVSLAERPVPAPAIAFRQAWLTPRASEAADDSDACVAGCNVGDNPRALIAPVQPNSERGDTDKHHQASGDAHATSEPSSGDGVGKADLGGGELGLGGGATLGLEGLHDFFDCPRVDIELPQCEPDSSQEDTTHPNEGGARSHLATGAYARLRVDALGRLLGRGRSPGCRRKMGPVLVR